MKRFSTGLVAGLLIGIAVTSAISIPVILSERESNHGRLIGRAEAAEALQAEFGEYDGYAPCKVLFSVKTTDVISIETNGIKTVRVIP